MDCLSVLYALKEDSVLNEGYITYDIRFTAYIKKSKAVYKILLNIEAQNTTKPKNELIAMLEDLIRNDLPEIKKANLVQKRGYEIFSVKAKWLV